MAVNGELAFTRRAEMALNATGAAVLRVAATRLEEVV